MMTSIAIEDEIHHLSLAQPAFPLEIFQLIIAELASNTTDSTKTTIKSCSLVCKAFLPFCRPFIFQGFEFGPVGPPNENQHRLQKFLQDCPHLAQYFQDVTYSVNHEQMKEQNAAMQQAFAQQPRVYHFSGPSPAEAHFDRMTAGGDHTLRYTLTNLRTLRIIHTDGMSPSDWDEDEQHTWNDMCDPSIHRVLKAYSLSQTLTNLHIESAGAIPMSVVMSIPNLRLLNLDDVDCTDWTSSSSEASAIAQRPRHVPKLETLVLHNVINFPLWTLTFCKALRSIHGDYVTFNKSIPKNFDDSRHTPTFNNLRSLHITSLDEWMPFCAIAEEVDLVAFPAVNDLSIRLREEDEFSAMNDIFDHVQALESLSIEAQVHKNRPQAGSLIQLQKCLDNCGETLKHISLHWSLHSFYEESFMQALNDALSFISGRNVVETITVHLTLEWFFELQPLDMPLFEQWKRFGALLVKDKQRDFPMLERVVVRQKTEAFMASPGDREPWADKDFLSVPLEPLRINTSGIDFVFDARKS
ncbi:hypothetical protein BJ165DRAFT_1513743 [Panaeolus papilionaceus]|nr:hypothetical protein BJ165DRAFT_1513743 [Panaeolus papilionaceus]